jgi:hypothetical protein
MIQHEAGRHGLSCLQTAEARGCFSADGAFTDQVKDKGIIDRRFGQATCPLDRTKYPHEIRQ